MDTGQFDKTLTNATAGIGYEFFQLPIAGQSAVYRERVYCYELYHQMRVIWPDCAYTLNGEVDKSGHQKLREMRADRCKPDLLVHIPGDMSGNYAVVEVKPCTVSLRGLRKDLQTLRLFSEEVGYRRAVYLIYGYDAMKAAQRVLRELANEPVPRLELWLHCEHGAPALMLRYA